jgi:cysteine-rich repeat protein
MTRLHPRGRSTRSALFLALSAVAAACSSDAGDVFGESSGAGPASGAGGAGEAGSGGGGAAVSGPATTGGGASATTSGPSTTSTTGGGGAGGEGGAGPTTSAGPTSTAAGATCGNGSIDGDELCDGDDLGDATCASLGVPGNGELRCVDCAYDTSHCVKCGNGDVDPGEDCDDGGDEAGDGCDASCHFEGTSCQSAIDVELDLGDTVTIATTNAEGPLAPGACIDAAGRGRIVRVVPASDGFVTAWVRRDGTTFDSSLRMGYACGEQTIVCADSYGSNPQQQPPGGEVGSLVVEAGSPVFVHVDAWSADDVGDFTVELALARGRCDDPVVVPVEPGSEQGIVLYGVNEGAGNDEVGDCNFQSGAGNGEDVTYELVPSGDDASPVDVSLTPLQGDPFNAVLHARRGICDDVEDEVMCSAQAGPGGAESLEDLSIDGGAFVHADAAQFSDGAYRMRVVPPAP